MPLTAMFEARHETWMETGVCRTENIPTSTFFPSPGNFARHDVRAAKQFCARCPVADECLNYALRTGERFGVWGGKSERQRRELRDDDIRGGRLARHYTTGHTRTERTKQPQTEWAIAIRDVLADREWHHISELDIAVLRVISDKRALNAVTVDNKSKRRPIPTQISPIVRQRGAQLVVVSVLQNLRRRGQAERVENRVRAIR
jgi:WhiB family redox-sensing transcriptional regulator